MAKDISSLIPVIGIVLVTVTLAKYILGFINGAPMFLVALAGIFIILFSENILTIFPDKLLMEANNVLIGVSMFFIITYVFTIFPANVNPLIVLAIGLGMVILGR